MIREIYKAFYEYTVGGIKINGIHNNWFMRSSRDNSRRYNLPKKQRKQR